MTQPRKSPLHNLPCEKSRADSFFFFFFTNKLPVFTLGYSNPPHLEVREQGQSSLCNVYSIQLMSMHTHTRTYSHTHGRTDTQACART